MKHSIPIVALLAALITPIAYAQSCGPVTVGAAGGANCTTPNLQDAINKATNDALCFDNEVWISDSIDGAFFNGGKISINGKEVAIVGGYTSSSGNACEDLVRTGRTAISGAGGTRASVFEIRGNSTVVLKHLDISGGDPSPGQNGGGINFDGQGTLVLNQTSVNSNVGFNGGGIYANGNISVYLESGVSVSGNAATNGGGIYLNRAGLEWNGLDGEMWLNKASGDGGGIYASGNARVDVFTRGRLLQPGQYFAAIYGNEATRGGALALIGSGARYAAYDRNPQQIAFNRAADRGGAVFMAPDGNTFPYFCAPGTSFVNNRANRGAVLYAIKGPSEFSFRNCAFPERPTAVCPLGGVCSSITGNIADNGAIFDSEYNSVSFFRAKLTGNSARDLFYVGDQLYDIQLRNSLVAQNTLTASIVNAPGLIIEHSTIADNVLVGPVFNRRVETVVTSIQRSIIWQPGLSLINSQANLPSGNLYENVSSDEAILQNHENNRTTNPQLMEGYGIAATSPAVDFASQVQTTDLGGFQRPVDLPSVPNAPGITADAGAFERQSGPLFDNFNNGFE